MPVLQPMSVHYDGVEAFDGGRCVVEALASPNRRSHATCAYSCLA